MKTSDRKAFWTSYVTSSVFLPRVCLVQKPYSLTSPGQPKDFVVMEQLELKQPHQESALQQSIFGMGKSHQQPLLG